MDDARFSMLLTFFAPLFHNRALSAVDVPTPPFWLWCCYRAQTTILKGPIGEVGLLQQGRCSHTHHRCPWEGSCNIFLHMKLLLKVCLVSWASQVITMSESFTSKKGWRGKCQCLLNERFHRRNPKPISSNPNHSLIPWCYGKGLPGGKRLKLDITVTIARGVEEENRSDYTPSHGSYQPCWSFDKFETNERMAFSPLSWWTRIKERCQC